MDRRAELTRQLRSARGWILLVGLLGFAVEMFVIYVLWNDRIDPAWPSWRTQLTLYDAAILAYFLVLWWFARYRPVLACALALAGFGGLQIFLAIADPSTLGQLFVLKVLFTIALVRGIQSARNAERLRRELDDVFS
jgi:small-conductance mechanosensitive channel